MLSVKTPDEVLNMIAERFAPPELTELVAPEEACGRVLAEDAVCSEFIPGFDRSTVDGYALCAADTFGCSEAIPAVLPLDTAVEMGAEAASPLSAGGCAPIPTGGALPIGADSVVMIEYTEDYGDGTVGIFRPAAPGENVIYRGDDAVPGSVILPAGRIVTVPDAGALAALGVCSVMVKRRLTVGIISTGDELVPVSAVPRAGQVRDVNSALLSALCRAEGAEVRSYGIVPDDEAALGSALDSALESCDTVIISGGSSVGQKDMSERLLCARGELLLHGIAMKPGKPTLLADVGGRPVWGLPGHPVAAFFTSELFVRPLPARMSGRPLCRYVKDAVLSAPVSANHGRAQYTGVRLRREGGVFFADPIRSKSGLIISLADSDGYFCIPRDCEGAAAGETVSVTLYHAPDKEV